MLDEMSLISSPRDRLMAVDDFPEFLAPLNKIH